MNDFGGPRWDELTVALDEAPSEVHKMWYRNIEECADYLFSNPTFRGEMGYSPVEIRDPETQARIYNEVWTGKMWEELQVSSSSLFSDLT